MDKADFEKAKALGESLADLNALAAIENDGREAARRNLEAGLKLSEEMAAAADQKFLKGWENLWNQVQGQLPPALRRFYVPRDPKVHLGQSAKGFFTNFVLHFQVPDHEEIEGRWRWIDQSSTWQLEQFEVYGLRVTFLEDAGSLPYAVWRDGEHFGAYEPDQLGDALAQAARLFQEERPALQKQADEQNANWEHPIAPNAKVVSLEGRLLAIFKELVKQEVQEALDAPREIPY